MRNAQYNFVSGCKKRDFQIRLFTNENDFQQWDAAALPTNLEIICSCRMRILYKVSHEQRLLENLVEDQRPPSV